MSKADEVYSQLERAIERGEITEAEARNEYFAAEEEAMELEREEWR